MLCVLPLGARKRHMVTISSDYQSVVVNEDSTVSFCYCGAAKRVSVYGDFFYAGDGERYRHQFQSTRNGFYLHG